MSTALTYLRQELMIESESLHRALAGGMDPHRHACARDVLTFVFARLDVAELIDAEEHQSPAPDDAEAGITHLTPQQRYLRLREFTRRDPTWQEGPDE